MQVQVCKKDLISERFEPSRFKIEIQSIQKNHLHVFRPQNKTIFGVPIMQVGICKFQRIENMGSGLHGLLLIPIVDVLLYCIIVYMYVLFVQYIYV